MIDTNQLQAHIRVVARARDNKVSLDELKKQRLKEWEETNAALLSDIANNSAFLTDAESRLRELTLQAYAETGEKQPVPGVGIRETIELRYNPKQAFDWAIKNPLALQLNTKVFEKIARGFPLDFVEYAKVYLATIAQDLSKYSKEEK